MTAPPPASAGPPAGSSAWQTAWFDQLARGWRGYVLIGLLALASALMGAARMPVLDRDEARFAQATRQMLETHDFIRIRVQDVERNKKPIGIYWLQAAAVTAAAPLTDGKLNEIWPYRIPSALGAALAAIAALWGGRALLPRRTAFIGAILFATCMVLGAEGMIAKTDAVLCGLTTLAMAALARLRVAERRRWLFALLFWIALGCGVLVKGPVTPMVAGLTLISIGFWEKSWRWMRPLLWWPGPLIAVAIVAPWAIAIEQATQGRFFAQAVGVDLASKVAGGSEGHSGLPGYHVGLLVFLIFPATFALPAGLRLAWRTLRKTGPIGHEGGEHEAALRFLIAWALPSFVAFELLPTKLPHYTLPTYPAIALISAAGLMAATRERWRITNLIGVLLFGLAGATLTAILALGSTFMPGDADASIRRALTAALIGVLVLGGALTVLLIVPRPTMKAAAAALAALIFSYSLRDRLLPEARKLHVSAEIAAALTRTRLSPREDRPLWVVGYGETSLVFDTRTSIRIATAQDAGARAASGDALAVEARELPALDAELARRGLMFVRDQPVRGLNYGNGKYVAVYVGDVEAPAAPPRSPPARRRR